MKKRGGGLNKAYVVGGAGIISGYVWWGGLINDLVFYA